MTDLLEMCKCGHPRKSHIYEEGACRPGFVCQESCREFEADDQVSKASPPAQDSSSRDARFYSLDHKPDENRRARELYNQGPAGRAAALEAQRDQASSLACHLEAVVAWSTPSWQRNVLKPALQIERRGYAVYDGPAAQPSPRAEGQPPIG